MAPFMLSIFWLGLFSSALFGLLYGLAMVYRKDVHLHARYMITTGLVFVVPGLSRANFNFLAANGLPALDFYETQIVMTFIGLALIAWDRMHGHIRAPFVVFTVLWTANLVIWHLLPGCEWWRAFTAWSAGVGA